MYKNKTEFLGKYNLSKLIEEKRTQLCLQHLSIESIKNLPTKKL